MIEISLELPKISSKRSKGGMGSFDYAALEKNLKTSEQKIVVAYTRAISEASQETRAIAVQELSSKVACNKRLVEERVTAEPITQYRVRGIVRILRKRIPLKHFTATQTKNGVIVETGYSTRRIRSGFGPDIQRLGGNVFVRVGRQRLPIRKATGVSLVRVAAKTGLEARLGLEFRSRARAKIKKYLTQAAWGILDA